MEDFLEAETSKLTVKNWLGLGRRRAWGPERITSMRKGKEAVRFISHSGRSLAEEGSVETWGRRGRGPHGEEPLWPSGGVGHFLEDSGNDYVSGREGARSIIFAGSRWPGALVLTLSMPGLTPCPGAWPNSIAPVSPTPGRTHLCRMDACQGASQRHRLVCGEVLANEMVHPSSGCFHFNRDSVDKYLLNSPLHARNYIKLRGGVLAWPVSIGP